jgi:hypothetical protein
MKSSDCCGASRHHIFDELCADCLEHCDFVNDFDDWVGDMLNSSDYSDAELMSFEEHYQNLLTFEENTENFIKHLKNN